MFLRASETTKIVRVHRAGHTHTHIYLHIPACECVQRKYFPAGQFCVRQQQDVIGKVGVLYLTRFAAIVNCRQFMARRVGDEWLQLALIKQYCNPTNGYQLYV